MDYELLLSLVKEELEYLGPFSFEYEYELMKAAGALVVLKEYIEAKIQDRGAEPPIYMLNKK